MKEMKEIFTEFDCHLLKDESPSVYFNSLIEHSWFRERYPFRMLAELKDVPQSPEHHPEGNVWNHTMLVIDIAAQKKEESENPRVFMWSALLHDLGKAPTTMIRKGRVTAYDHDKEGKLLSMNFLRKLSDDEDFISKVAQMVRWHMQILFVVKEMPFADINKMITEVSIDEIALLSLCDRLGRGAMTEEIRSGEEENVRLFIKKCQEHEDAVKK